MLENNSRSDGISIPRPAIPKRYLNQGVFPMDDSKIPIISGFILVYCSFFNFKEFKRYE